MPQQTPQELRQRAKAIRDSAMRAERLRDARAELQEAERLEREAAQLEGIHQHQPQPVAKAQPCPHKRAAIDKALADIEARFGRKQ